jgi:hypothetical protein
MGSFVIGEELLNLANLNRPIDPAARATFLAIAFGRASPGADRA